MTIPNSIVSTDSMLDQLKNIEGPVILPHDERYDEARRTWNLAVDQYPAIIVVARNANDVSEAVRFAAKFGLCVAVRSTGHGVIRKANDAMLIVTSEMREVTINALTRTAYISAGAQWKDVVGPAYTFGLAPLLGSSSGVGVIGYLLGGGMGWLARKYGLAADTVVSYDVVIASGEKLKVSRTENSDLFWALRGGGGTFGVITSVELEMFPVTEVFGGYLMYPAEHAVEVFKRFREWTANMPDEFTSSVTVMNYPPIPQIPEVIRGKSFVVIRGAYAGDLEKGAELVGEWTRWNEPVINTFRVMSMLESDTISEDPQDPLPGMSTGAWLRELSDEVIDMLVDAGNIRGGAPFVKVEVRHTGGAIKKGAGAHTALGHRESAYVMQAIAMTPTPEALHGAESYADGLKARLAPYIPGVYMNFVEGNEAQKRTAQAFSQENLSRLEGVKAKYDPENVFSYAYTIKPKLQHA